MLVAGIDIGSRTTVALLLRDKKVLSYDIAFSGPDNVSVARGVMEAALSKIDAEFDAVEYIVATGYGRLIIPFAQENVSEISCHAMGANHYFPSARTVLDMGGQDCKAMRVDGKGNVIKFAMNDKCAAGTGRFLEVMADTLRLPLEEIGELSLKSKNEVKIASQCTVFAKYEVASLMRKGIPKEDILAGLHEAISDRVFGLLQKVGVEKDFVITGGIAKNIGVVRRLEKKVQLQTLIPAEPQIVGALGAALIAEDKLSQKQFLQRD